MAMKLWKMNLLGGTVKSQKIGVMRKREFGHWSKAQTTIPFSYAKFRNTKRKEKWLPYI